MIVWRCATKSCFKTTFLSIKAFQVRPHLRNYRGRAISPLNSKMLSKIDTLRLVLIRSFIHPASVSKTKTKYSNKPWHFAASELQFLYSSRVHDFYLQHHEVANLNLCSRALRKEYYHILILLQVYVNLTKQKHISLVLCFEIYEIGKQ